MSGVSSCFELLSGGQLQPQTAFSVPAVPGGSRANAPNFQLGSIKDGVDVFTLAGSVHSARDVC